MTLLTISPNSQPAQRISARHNIPFGRHLEHQWGSFSANLIVILRIAFQ